MIPMSRYEFTVWDHLISLLSVLSLSSSIVPSEDDPQEVYDLLKKNFERAYYGNTRAPLGFYIHAAWWAAEDLEWRFEGFK